MKFHLQEVTREDEVHQREIHYKKKKKKLREWRGSSCENITRGSKLQSIYTALIHNAHRSHGTSGLTQHTFI